jgi:hypothetical protein
MRFSKEFVQKLKFPNNSIMLYNLNIQPANQNNSHTGQGIASLIESEAIMFRPGTCRLSGAAPKWD